MKRAITFLGIMLFIQSSCINELTDKINNIENLNWNPTLAVPFVVGDFTIGELAKELSEKNLEITTADDGTSTFIYSQPSIFSQQASELFSISDQNFNTSINAGYNLPAGGVNSTIKTNQDYKFDLNNSEGDKLREIQLKNGILNLHLSGNIPATGAISVTFSSIIKDGNPIIVNYSWSSITSQDYTEQIDLTKATIDLTEGNTTTNSFNFTTDLTIYYNGNAISANDGFNIDVNLTDLNFGLLTATFANRNIAPDPSYFKLNFIDEINKGIYFLEEPAMHFKINNSIGAPVNIDLNQISAHSITNGSLPLIGSIVDTPIDIAYPVTPGNTKQTTLTIDNNNSNLPQILLFQPDSIEYTFSGIVNPAKNDDIHFVTDTSSLTANVILEVPLYGYINNILIAEPYDFDGAAFEDVDNALIRISGENGLPLDAKVQCFFMDDNDIVLDSLIYDDTNIFPAAKTDVNGNVTGTSQSQIDIALSSNRIEKISTAKTLVIRALLNTPDSPIKSVRFKEENMLKVSMFGQTEFNIEF